VTDAQPYEIVGVARASRYATLGEGPQPAFYRPLSQEYVDTMALLVRSEGEPAAALNLAMGALRAAHPGVPVLFSGTLEEVAERSLWPTRVGASLLVVLGGLALCLTAVGLYGVTSYAVAQRRFEVAVRMAVGADRRDVVRLIVLRTLGAVGVGLAVGVPPALLTMSALQTIVYELENAPAVLLGAAVIVLIATALVASVLPARRAAAVQPAELLR
jgi:hypothetical protein